MISLYGIPNCDTVKTARAWLVTREIPHAFHDYKKQGVPPDRLAAWAGALGWERLLNRQGTTWRRLDPARQAAVIDAATAMALMVEEPSLVRRPVVEWPDGRFSVGFAEADWAARLPAG
jgi:arsenate reductase (glutaredoxin)